MGKDHPEGSSFNDAILASSSYIPADRDTEFMQREELRPLRLGLELLKPELIQQEQGIQSTIVVFGSARLQEPVAAELALLAAEREVAEHPEDPTRHRQVAVAKRQRDLSKYYDVAREFARLVSSSCQVDGRCDYVIVTGGGPGIMEAANRGAADVQAKSIGLNITLPHEQHANHFITPELCFQFRYFGLRKMHFHQKRGDQCLMQSVHMPSCSLVRDPMKTVRSIGQAHPRRRDNSRCARFRTGEQSTAVSSRLPNGSSGDTLSITASGTSHRVRSSSSESEAASR